MGKDYKAYISHILESIMLIEQYTQNISFEEFEKDRKTIDAVIRNFEVIGEAINNIPDEVRERYPDVEWSEAVGFRNVMIHNYFGLDLEAVWDTIRKNIPDLKKHVKKVLDSEIKKREGGASR